MFLYRRIDWADMKRGKSEVLVYQDPCSMYKVMETGQKLLTLNFNFMTKCESQLSTFMLPKKLFFATARLVLQNLWNLTATSTTKRHS
jgi:hypothetical protein